MESVDGALETCTRPTASASMSRTPGGWFHAADQPPGSALRLGQPVIWTYRVTNTGNVELTQVIVVDDREGTIACPYAVLAPSAFMTCTASGTAHAGQYANVATTWGLPPVGEAVWSADASHYRGGATIYLPLVKR